MENYSIEYEVEDYMFKYFDKDLPDIKDKYIIKFVNENEVSDFKVHLYLDKEEWKIHTITKYIWDEDFQGVKDIFQINGKYSDRYGNKFIKEFSKVKKETFKFIENMLLVEQQMKSMKKSLNSNEEIKFF